MSLDKKLKELNQKYRELLREGKTDEATDVVQKARRLKEGNEEDNSEESRKEEKGKEKPRNNKNSKPKELGNPKDFEKVKGAGPELAVELSEQFESVEELAKADVDDLVPVPGIAEKTANSIIKEANKLIEG